MNNYLLLVGDIDWVEEDHLGWIVNFIFLLLFLLWYFYGTTNW